MYMTKKLSCNSVFISMNNNINKKKILFQKWQLLPRKPGKPNTGLGLLDRSKLIDKDIKSYLDSIEHIVNILTKIVKTSQQGIQNL